MRHVGASSAGSSPPEVTGSLGGSVGSMGGWRACLTLAPSFLARLYLEKPFSPCLARRGLPHLRKSFLLSFSL